MLGSKSKRGIAVMRIHTRQTKVCVNTLKRQRSFLVRNNLADPAKNVQINVNMMMIGTAFLTRLLQLFLFIASFSTIERFPCSVMCCSTRNIILHDIDKNNNAQLLFGLHLTSANFFHHRYSSLSSHHQSCKEYTKL